MLRTIDVSDNYLTAHGIAVLRDDAFEVVVTDVQRRLLFTAHRATSRDEPTIHRSLRCLTICVVICAATSALPATSAAGANGLASLERHAAGTIRTTTTSRGVTWCLSDDKPHVSRILAACDKILAREPKFASCYVLAAALGAEVGDETTCSTGSPNSRSSHGRSRSRRTTTRSGCSPGSATRAARR